MTDREIIQHNLKVLRKAKGLTQEELGKKLGKTKTAVASWENGTSLPPVDVVMKMAKIYGTTMDKICCEDAYSSVSDQYEYIGIHKSLYPNIRKMFDCYLNMTPENRYRLFSIMYLLANEPSETAIRIFKE